MKVIKSILLSLSVLLGIILIIGFFLILAKTFQMKLELSANGFSNYTKEFSSLKELFTVTIALLSTYFILFQIENIKISNKRTKEILENEIKSKTLEQSNFFYIQLQPRVRETYLIIDKCNKYLLTQKWIFIEFTDQSVSEQNLKWEKEYDELNQVVKDKIIEIINQFESLSAIILYGNIDHEMAFNLFGRPFIRQIEVMYPFIAGNRSREKKENEDNYNSIIKLYNDWKLKIINYGL